MTALSKKQASLGKILNSSKENANVVIFHSRQQPINPRNFDKVQIIHNIEKQTASTKNSQRTIAHADSVHRSPINKENSKVCCSLQASPITKVPICKQITSPEEKELNVLIKKAMTSLSSYTNSKESSPNILEIVENLNHITNTAPANVIIEKWKKFAFTLANSFESLKRKYTSSLESNSKYTQIISEMQEQNNHLKKLLSANIAKTAPSNGNQMQQELANLHDKLIESSNQIQKYKEENLSMHNQLNDYIKQNQLLKQKYSTLYDEHSKCTLDHDAQYFKSLYEQHLKESSKLAEQLICLRSDLDKSNAEHNKKTMISGYISAIKEGRHSSQSLSHIKGSICDLPKKIESQYNINQ